MMTFRANLVPNKTTSIIEIKPPEDTEQEDTRKKCEDCIDQPPEAQTATDTPDPDPTITKEMINIFRQKGKDYQAWMDYPDDTNCQRSCIVLPSTLRLEDLLLTSDGMPQWEMYADAWVGPPEEIGDPRLPGLPIGTYYHKLCIRSRGLEKYGSVGWNKYHGRVTYSAVFADNNVRVDGPQWSQIAQAHYQQLFEIDSLKYVFRITVVNEETHPFVDEVLYPRYGLELESDSEVRTWQYGSDDYQEIMGTTLGKAVGALVLGAFPRGTRRIAQIHTWQYEGDLQMRFDISEVLGRAQLSV